MEKRKEQKKEIVGFMFEDELETPGIRSLRVEFKSLKIGVQIGAKLS